MPQARRREPPVVLNVAADRPGATGLVRWDLDREWYVRASSLLSPLPSMPLRLAWACSGGGGPRLIGDDGAGDSAVLKSTICPYYSRIPYVLLGQCDGDLVPLLLGLLAPAESGEVDCSGKVRPIEGLMRLAV